MKKIIYIICIFGLGLLGSTGVTHAINYDTGRVAEARLGRNNELRSEMGLVEYSFDNRLENTANEWSEYMNNLGTWTHKRSKNDGFYTYSSLENWFGDRGLEFANVKGVTFTENVGVGYVSCKQEECTDEVIKAIKTTRNMYMGEAKYRGAHYKSLVQPRFRYIGFGLVINSKNKYYLTVHYATSIKDISGSKNKPETKKVKKININELDKLSIN